MKLTIIRGVPGSGKSTYAKKNFNCLILEQDMFFIRNGKYKWYPDGMPSAVAWCKNMATTALENGMDVCVVNTNVKRRYVEEYKKLAEQYNASFEVIRMNTSYRNIHNVPTDVLDNMKNGFEDWPGETTIA